MNMRTNMNQSMPFLYTTGPYSTDQAQTYTDFSPTFSGSFCDFNTDFNSDSVGSPATSNSPALSAACFDPNGLLNWPTEKVERFPESEDCLKSEPWEGNMISAIPSRPLTASPSINPVELSIQVPTTTQDLTFNSYDGINTNSPMFQPQLMGVTLPSQRPAPLALIEQQQQQPIELAEDVKRYPSRSNLTSRSNLKRKSSCSSSSDEEEHRRTKRVSTSPPPSSSRSPPRVKKEKGVSPASATAPKKTAHNMIEKRYRTNLNDKIAQLRDSVPSLRLAAMRMESGNYEDECEGEEGDLSGMIPAPKLNKATILSKATEYINELERKVYGLDTENRALKARLEQMNMLLISRSGGPPDTQYVWT